LKTFISALVALAISGAVGYFSFNAGYTGTFESILLALMTGIVSELTILLWRTDALELRNGADSKALIRHIDRLESLEENEAIFQSMEKDFLEVRSDSHGSKDLFVSYLHSEILALKQQLSDANKRKEMTIKSDYIINVDGVFDSLDVSSERHVKLTYPISPNEPWVGGPSDRRYFEVLLKKVANGTVSNLSMLFLLDEQIDPNGRDIQRILRWLNKNTRVRAKYIPIKEFSNVCSLNGISVDHLDFGIYGDRMTFRATVAGPEHEGIYSKDTDLIERYSNVFDQTWNSENLALSPTPSKESVKKITLQEICKIAPANKVLAIETK